MRPGIPGLERKWIVEGKGAGSASLRPGETVRGRVLDASPSGILTLQVKGELVKAATQVLLSPGETAFFKVVHSRVESARYELALKFLGYDVEIPEGEAVPPKDLEALDRLAQQLGRQLASKDASLSRIRESLHILVKSLPPDPRALSRETFESLMALMKLNRLAARETLLQALGNLASIPSPNGETRAILDRIAHQWLLSPRELTAPVLRKSLEASGVLYESRLRSLVLPRSSDGLASSLSFPQSKVVAPPFPGSLSAPGGSSPSIPSRATAAGTEPPLSSSGASLTASNAREAGMPEAVASPGTARKLLGMLEALSKEPSARAPRILQNLPELLEDVSGDSEPGLEGKLARLLRLPLRGPAGLPFLKGLALGLERDVSLPGCRDAVKTILEVLVGLKTTLQGSEASAARPSAEAATKTLADLFHRSLKSPSRPPAPDWEIRDLLKLLRQVAREGKDSLSQGSLAGKAPSPSSPKDLSHLLLRLLELSPQGREASLLASKGPDLLEAVWSRPGEGGKLEGLLEVLLAMRLPGNSFPGVEGTRESMPDFWARSLVHPREAPEGLDPWSALDRQGDFSRKPAEALRLLTSLRSLLPVPPRGVDAVLTHLLDIGETRERGGALSKALEGVPRLVVQAGEGHGGAKVLDLLAQLKQALKTVAPDSLSKLLEQAADGEKTSQASAASLPDVRRALPPVLKLLADLARAGEASGPEGAKLLQRLSSLVQGAPARVGTSLALLLDLPPAEEPREPLLRHLPSLLQAVLDKGQGDESLKTALEFLSALKITLARQSVSGSPRPAAVSQGSSLPGEPSSPPPGGPPSSSSADSGIPGESPPSPAAEGPVAPAPSEGFQSAGEGEKGGLVKLLQTLFFRGAKEGGGVPGEKAAGRLPDLFASKPSQANPSSQGGGEGASPGSSPGQGDFKPLVPEDLKENLLRLKALLQERGTERLFAGGDDGVEESAGKSGARLMESVEGMLKEIELNQLLSKTSSSWITFLPLLWKGLAEGRVAFRKGGGGRGGQGGEPRCVLELHLEEWGALGISVTMRNRFFFVTFRAENRSLEDLLQSTAPQLREALEARGVSVGGLNVTGGEADLARNLDRLDPRGRGLNLEV